MSLELFSLETIQNLAHDYGYWVIFLGIALENTGIPLPGETITLVGGFLAGSGELDYQWVLVAAIGGAILGDNFGYWLGRWGGLSLLERIERFFRVPKQYLTEAKDRFHKNAAKAVFFGRFIALLRIFAGPLAGITRMPYLQFLLWNCSGAVVWALVTVTFAYVVGQIIPLHQLVNWAGQLGILILLGLTTWIAIPIWRESRQNKKQTEN
ncbi:MULTISPECIES: DedA family protein [Spirulina sp. CCY15215]|uniref:DedA family protein n=1 Tax=Spirulina sp. CCY15215 TaxID=2767591 RepID=UPI00194F2116|nr:DedA family protein [Spirulina major]